MTWQASIVTLFPSMFPGPLSEALAGKALSRGIWSMQAHDLREFGLGPHRKVDDPPFGGGPGMVLRPDVVDAALKAARPPDDVRPLIVMAARGRPFTQNDARRLADGPGMVVLCGRYEGIDQRVIEAHEAEEFCVGEAVVAGGEMPALMVLDACIRLLPGVMGATESGRSESFSHDLLEYPHYTRPGEWCGWPVPPILLSGHHDQIMRWRRKQSERATRERRPNFNSLA